MMSLLIILKLLSAVPEYNQQMIDNALQQEKYYNLDEYAGPGSEAYQK